MKNPLSIDRGFLFQPKIILRYSPDVGMGDVDVITKKLILSLL